MMKKLMLATLLCCSSIQASTLFDQTTSNVWLFSEDGQVTGFSAGAWVHNYSDIDFPVTGEQLILVNGLPNSSTPMISDLAPISVAGLEIAELNLGDEVDTALLQMLPAEGAYNETIELTVEVDLARYGDSGVYHLEITDGSNVLKQVTFNSKGKLGELNNVITAYVVTDGQHNLTATLTDGSSAAVLGSISQTYVIESDDPLGVRRDSDTDGLPDLVEVAIGLDPLEEDNLSQDSNGDGWAEFDQWLRSDNDNTTDIPVDSDNDGWSDIDEQWRGTNPFDDAIVLATNNSDLAAPAAGTSAYRQTELRFKDRPSVNRLYEVEYLLDAQRTQVNDEPVWNGAVRAFSLNGLTLYDSHTLLTDSELLWADLPPENFPDRLKQQSVESTLQDNQQIEIRLAASKPLIVDVIADSDAANEATASFSRWHYRKVVGAKIDISPRSFETDENWTTASEWKALYIDFLEQSLVQSIGIEMDVESTLQTETGLLAINTEFSTHEVPAPIDPLQVSSTQKDAIERLAAVLAQENRSVEELFSAVYQSPEHFSEVIEVMQTLLPTAPASDVNLWLQHSLLSGDDNTYEELVTLTTDILMDGISLSDEVQSCGQDDISECAELPALSISASVSVTESGQEAPYMMYVTFQLDRPSESNVSFDFMASTANHETATENVDYGAMGGTVNLLAGQRVVTIAIPIYSDALVEAIPEEFHLSLLNLDGVSYDAGNLVIAINDNTSDPEPAQLLTGRFFNLGAGGIGYETASVSGTTNESGEFEYYAGEEVSFYLGELFLGKAVGAELVTAFDLAGRSPTLLKRELTGVSSGGNLSFNHLANIAIFLYNFDSDANPENGITISTAVAELFADVDIDLTDNFKNLHSLRHVRKFLVEANEQNLFGEDRAPLFPSLAVAYLHEDLGIVAPVRSTRTLYSDEDKTSMTFQQSWEFDDTLGAYTKIETDTNGDGAFNTLELLEYNDAVYQTARKYDGNGDGVWESDITYELDLYGNFLQQQSFNAEGLRYSYEYEYTPYGDRLSYLYDSDGDGLPNKAEYQLFDDLGRLIQKTVDSDGDGVIDSIENTSYFEDTTSIELIESDIDADGEIEYRARYTYTSDGNRLASYSDDDGDGPNEELITGVFEYNDEGVLTVSVSYSYNVTGAVSRIYQYSYDSSGQLLRTDYDYNGDGAYDSFAERDYNEFGNLILFAEGNYPDQYTRIEFREYIADDIVSKIEKDTDGNGTVDDVTRHTFDDNLNITLTEYDTDNDGVVDKSIAYTYNELNLATGQYTDKDGDDVWDIIYIFDYDTNGHMTYRGYDYDGDSQFDNVTEWSLGQYGEILEEYSDSNGDGIIDKVDMRTYENSSRAGWYMIINSSDWY